MNRAGSVRAGSVERPRRPFGAVVGAVVCTLACVLLAACGIPLDRAPRDIASEPEAGVANASAAPGGSAGGARIFFASADPQSGVVRLQQVFRSVPISPNDVLGALFKGVTDVEARRLTTQIPLGTKLNSVATTPDGLVIINVDRTIFQARAQALVVAVAQIVYTATSLPNIDRVRLLVDGAPSSWPAGDGRQRDGDLTPLAYPALYPVSQPDLPPVPSPTQAPTTLPPTTATTAPAAAGKVVIVGPDATTTTTTAPAAEPEPTPPSDPPPEADDTATTEAP